MGAQADKFVVAHNRERVGLARKAHDCGRLRALVDKVSGENEGVALLVGDLVQERAQLLVAAVHVAHDDGAPFLRSGGQENVLGRLAASVVCVCVCVCVCVRVCVCVSRVQFGGAGRLHMEGRDRQTGRQTDTHTQQRTRGHTHTAAGAGP